MQLTSLFVTASALVHGIVALAPDVTPEAAELIDRRSLRARDYDDYGCSLACIFLNAVLSGKVSYPKSGTYNYEESRYWSQQQASVIPACRVSPTSAIDVSVTLLVLETQQCQFAVKSGGHAAFAGASNINTGVTIDMINLNQVTVSKDRKQTSVGPGNRWFDVYSKLSPMGLTVAGGRVADIGVGGLTLGGGISYFSQRYGWACDNVVNYEVVFADGTIRNVNQQSYPDLYFALRGGGNNFGIVTRFDLATYPQGNMWGGSTFHMPTDEAAILQAFENFNINAASDLDAALFLAFAYVQSADFVAIGADYFYGKPVENPPIFHNFTSITPFQSTLRFTNLTDLTLELNASNPGGFRQTYWTFTVKNSAPLLTNLVAIFNEELVNVKTAANIVPAFVIQPITTAMISHFSQNGGNALGITSADGPLTLLNIAISWSSPSDDTRILAMARNIVNRGTAAAQAMGLSHPFLYQNYAAAEQKVFDSYGAANKKKLVETSKKYDPRGVFEVLQPGYFKLG